MKYQDWEQSVPSEITNDRLWRMEVYRLALFASDLAWSDATKLAQDRRARGLSDQLYRAIGSVSANVAEGYSRGTGRDRARFYEYALGSVRESRDWYYKGRYVLGEAVTSHRLDLLAQITRLLPTIVPAERGAPIKEETIPYTITAPDSSTDVPLTEQHETRNTQQE
jgi:four helix bundle protein